MKAATSTENEVGSFNKEEGDKPFNEREREMVNLSNNCSNRKLLRREIIFVLLTNFHLQEVVPEFQPELWSPSLGRVEYPPILGQTLQPDTNLWFLVFQDFKLDFRLY